MRAYIYKQLKKWFVRGNRSMKDLDVIKQIFDKVKWDIRNYSVELVIFDDAQHFLFAALRLLAFIKHDRKT